MYQGVFKVFAGRVELKVLEDKFDNILEQWLEVKKQILAFLIGKLRFLVKPVDNTLRWHLKQRQADSAIIKKMMRQTLL